MLYDVPSNVISNTGPQSVSGTLCIAFPTSIHTNAPAADRSRGGRFVHPAPLREGVSSSRLGERETETETNSLYTHLFSLFVCTCVYVYRTELLKFGVCHRLYSSHPLEHAMQEVCV